MVKTTMPYKNKESLPKQVSALPDKAKTIWMAAFNAAHDGGRSETMSMRIAWAAVKKKYQKTENRWVAKGKLGKPRLYKLKSDLSGSRIYMADFVFGTTEEDSDGDAVPYQALTAELAGMSGDLEHAGLYNDDYIAEYGHNPFYPGEELFTVQDSFFDGKHTIGTLRFNTNHPLFSEAWGAVLADKFGISLEYAVSSDLKTWKVEGISGAFDPKNKKSRLLQIREE